MKRFIVSATNTTAIPSDVETIEATDEEIETLDDKIKSAENDFDFLMSGLEQLEEPEAIQFLEDIHADIRGFIEDVANVISQ